MLLNPLRLGTRGSALALVQAEWVTARLKDLFPSLEVETVIVKTTADRAPHIPLSQIGDKALWVADLEDQLRTGQIDLAVHSMKDVPAEIAPGLIIGAVPERECPLDALALPANSAGVNPALSDPEYVGSAIHFPQVQEALHRMLPRGARVGTSSDRRKGQLLLWRPDLQVTPIRGNVDTRLRKLDSGEWDALVLAAAGLRRLGRGDRISSLFPPRRLVPAAGQGALALEIREIPSSNSPAQAPQADSAHAPSLTSTNASQDRAREVQQIVTALNHGPTAAGVAAERSFVRAISGGCSVPLGVYSSLFNQCLELWVRAVEPEPIPGGPPPLQDLQLVTLPDENPFADLQWAVDLGRTVGERFLQNGGKEFVERLNLPARQ